MTKFSLLCPTRKRPDGFTRMAASAYETASGKNDIEIIAYRDNDDETAYPAMVNGRSILYVVGDRIVLSQMWNECYSKATGEILMQCADDLMFRTPGWDEAVVEAFSKYDDRIVLVFGEDGIQGEVMATHGFLHRNWVTTLGYFVPPYFASDYNDLWLTEVARLVGRFHFLPHVYTEHMHFSSGKSPIDENTKDRLRRHRAQHPRAIYEGKEHERVQDAGKLLKFIELFHT